MLISALLTAAIWPVDVTKDCEPNADSIMVGVAKNEEGKLIYCELVSQLSEQSIKVSYLTKGKVFAEKILHFSTGPLTPSVIQKDFRVGEVRQADVSEKNVSLHYQASTHKKTNTAVIPLQKIDILDAGFDNFIRGNWEQLQAGKTLSVNFASMLHLKTLPLRISIQPLDKCLSKPDENATLKCFIIEVDNSLLRMLLGNIKITYDKQRRLHEFNGVVNIQDDNQGDQKAIIRYFYSSDYLPSENQKNIKPQ